MDGQTVPKETIDKYSTIFPEPIIEIWKKHGFGGYAKGYFWTINPDDYYEVLSKWIVKKEYEDYYPIMRTAFGDLILIYNLLEDNLDRYARFITVDVRHCKLNFITIAIDSFINDYLSDTGSLLAQTNIEPSLIQYERFEIGILNSKQCYGFETILALGGNEVKENIKIVDFDIHLDILTQALEAPLEG